MKFTEVITFIIASGVGLFILGRLRELKELPRRGLMLASYFLLWAAWLATNLEEYYLEDLLNYTEHLFEALSSVLLLLWVWQVMIREKGARL